MSFPWVFWGLLSMIYIMRQTETLRPMFVNGKFILVERKKKGWYLQQSFQYPNIPHYLCSVNCEEILAQHQLYNSHSKGHNHSYKEHHLSLLVKRLDSAAAYSFFLSYLIKQSGVPVFSIHISSDNHFFLQGGNSFTNRGMTGFLKKTSESSVAHS